MEEVAAANSEPTEQEPHTLERQTSWALPEIAPSPCSLVAWGRADLGQTGVGSEAACIGPVAVEALQNKDIVYAAGSVYNSAYVTRTPLFSRLACTSSPHHAHFPVSHRIMAHMQLPKACANLHPHPAVAKHMRLSSHLEIKLDTFLTDELIWQAMARHTPQDQTMRSS